MSEDLNRLITLTSQQPKPFIFVGADLGALISRFYTQMYELYVFENSFHSKKKESNSSSSSDVSHLFLIDPLVETLFDNEQWKDYWYLFLID